MTHPLYDLWRGMHQRCANPASNSFKWYGAKGVTVCQRWASLANFVNDMGPRPAGHTLDRWPNRGGNYEPGNCRWATVAQQNSNKGDTVLIEHQGQTMPLAAWAREAGMSKAALHYRVRRLKLPMGLAMTLPIDKHGTRRALKEIK